MPTLSEISLFLRFCAPTDLTQAEREVLVNIRKRKLELLQEISQLKDELTEVNTDIESMDTEEG